MSRTSDFSFTIDMPVVRQWENIDGVRASLQTCVALLFQDVDQRHTLAMIAGELLENAVKYGDWGDGLEVCRFRVWGQIGGDCHIMVSNPIDSDARARPVFEVIERLQDAASPAEAYQARLIEIAASSAPVTQLGLLRIAYEGGCRLAGDLTSDTLTVTATIASNA